MKQQDNNRLPVSQSAQPQSQSDFTALLPVWPRMQAMVSPSLTLICTEVLR